MTAAAAEQTSNAMRPSSAAGVWLGMQMIMRSRCFPPQSDLMPRAAQAAARALLENSDLGAADIVKKSLAIAGDLCIYTNQQHTIEVLEW